jgi:hypothetical protein
MGYYINWLHTFAAHAVTHQYIKNIMYINFLNLFFIILILFNTLQYIINLN